MCDQHQSASQIRKANHQGHHWISDSSRLAIYLRDGLACAYCGASLEEGAQLSLDHIVPAAEFIRSGVKVDNSAGNLVTCCRKCNSSRGDRNLSDWTAAVAHYLGVASGAEIEAKIHEMASRDMKKVKAEAKEMIARRGTAAKAMAAI